MQQYVVARDRYDAVVVGAGPAGSIAALVLARGGASVALADKSAFPRDKACGDLIGPRGVQVLADLKLTVPDAGQGGDLLAVGPSGRRSKLPAYPWRTYPGHGWLFPGAGGQANVGIGIGMGGTRRHAPLRGDLARLTALLARWGDLAPGAAAGPVIGGWLRMGGTGTPPAAGNVLLAGDAAGLINPLQGEGIGPAMVSARLAAEAVLAGPALAASAYTEAVEAAFGQYMAGASALQRVLL